MVVASSLSRYRTIARIGSGGMATVSLAEDTVLGRHVALKRMTSFNDAHGLSRLRREALAGASLSHPNVVSVYDVVSTEDDDLVIVMEYVEGETLGAALRRLGRLPAREATRILAGVASGLDAIHRQGIVHRDVKPANILLGRDGSVKLTDLGIAAVPDRTRITTAGSMLGSLNYMAPEQLEDGPTTPAIDVYALAAVAFEALSGRKARVGSSPIAVAHELATSPPPDLLDAWPQAPRRAAEVLRRGMARDAAVRPGSAGQLIRELSGAVDPPTPSPHAHPIPPRWGSQPNLRAHRDNPPAAPTSTPESGDGPSRRTVLPLLVTATILLVALGIALNSGGGTSRRASSRRAARAGARTAAANKGHPVVAESAAAKAGSGAGASAPGPGGAPPPAPTTGPGATGAASAGSPVTQVEDFYHLAAAHQYAQAWALADPAFQAQLGGYQSFVDGQQADRSITFDSAAEIAGSPTNATVAIRTTSVRTNGTQHCAGTVDVVTGQGTWLLNQIDINCTPAGGRFTGSPSSWNGPGQGEPWWEPGRGHGHGPG